ncbi:hypothetical protein [Chamaesiphon sp.]|uniref:hypothetical protein n=1 Tax=Chamaesiphon sp. TaxID=2814140 RepID=UPI00359307A0
MNSSNLPEPSAVEIQLRQTLDAVLAAPLQSAQRAKAMSRLLCVLRQITGIRSDLHLAETGLYGNNDPHQ